MQVNTYSSEYSRATGVQEVMTTKSGADQFHGSAADWFYYQNWFAKTHFTNPKGYLPFHGNNMSFSVGGPIVPHRQFFFYFAVEPLRSSLATNSLITFADPQFITWAQQNYPNTVGTHVLSTYLPANVGGVSVQSTAASIPGCDTSSTKNLPCNLPLVDQGNFSAPQIRNGAQYFVRIDKYFKNDRIYGSFYRTLLNYGAASAIPVFSALNNNWQRAFQVNYTHNFSPTTLNEAIFGANRVEGVLGSGAKDYSVPSIAVQGISTEAGQAFGVGFAQGDFIQHNYHWRDVLTHVRGTHTLKFGYEGWYGDDVEPFQGPWSQPKFSFDNLLTLAQDAPHTEGGVMYDPVAGQQKLWEWNAASRTWGVFAQDTWTARRNLTVTLGFRYDDQGNPYSRTDTTVFGNFYLAGGSVQEQVANGIARPTRNALNRSPKAYNPRAGVAWDVTGKGDWVVRSGFGLYANWLTSANVQEEFRGNPPGLILPTFFAGSSTPPVFTQGTGSTPPFGFTFPSLAGSALCPTAPCLDSKGGIAGAAAPIGGINPNVKSPTAYIYAAAVEHKIGNNLSARVLYSGSHSANLVGNGNQAGLVSYGVDINAQPGDLLNKPPGSPPTRLNPSFGPIAYADNDRVANYNGITFDVRGRAKNTFFDVSYTRSSSKDDAGNYPTAINPHQFYGPSPWDVPHRLSATLNYQIPGMNDGHGVAGVLTAG